MPAKSPIKQQRKPRSYKISDEHYLKAKKRAEREKGKLTNIIESVIIAYAYDMNIAVTSVPKDNRAYALEIFSTKPNETMSDRIKNAMKK